MWEADELGSEDILWAGTVFLGGIAEQQQAPCGAISASAVYFGLHHRCPLSEKEQAKKARRDARLDAAELVKSFSEKFGTINCRELIGFDFTDTEATRQAVESGTWHPKCEGYVKFILDKIYELGEKERVASTPQKVVIYTTPGCPICAAAMQDLEEQGISFKEISTEGNPDAIDEIRRLSDGKNIVPIIVSDGEVKVGFGGG